MFVPPLLMLLAGVFGLLFSVPNGSLGKPYFIAFAVAAVAGTLLVVPRGLVVTVAQIPILFALVTFFTAWFTGSLADPENGGATATTSKRARLVTSAYPIIQQFPWLLILMIICVIIAVWRYLEITRTQEKSLNTQRKAAKQRQHRDEAAVESSSQVRRRLAESDRRVASRSQERPASRRPAADIIRDAEARRQARQQAARSRQETSRSGARPAASASSASRNAEQLRERPVDRSGERAQQRSNFAQRAQQPTSRWQSRPHPGQAQFTQDSTSPNSTRQQPRRPIERPNAPQRPTQEFPRRQAAGTARMWGEQSSPESRSEKPRQSPARQVGNHRRTEEWPPRQQRPRQERITGRDSRSRYRK
ncbi:DUF6542 domain-containing protein [Corynebacterium sp. 045007]|uniref:DUF6542 domain-containing protein n=1 Tax=Corynebacterium sp. 045007 TaxID=3156078 RepID=UPI00345C0A41